jgi:hypothetical protein
MVSIELSKFMKGEFLMRIHIAIGLVFIMCIMGCASTAPPTLFQPAADDVISYFVNGMPLGAIDNSSTSMLMSLETAELAGTKYMRLWFLLKNKNNESFLLDPANAFELSAGDYDMIAEKPSTILASIENEKAASLIVQAVGGALQGMTVRDTKITSPKGETWKVNDADAKREAINDRNAARMEATNYWYDAFKNSVSSGILRKNTMFQGQSVNGYVYFELPKSHERSLYFDHAVTLDPTRRDFILTIRLPKSQKTVQFKPISGE